MIFWIIFGIAVVLSIVGGSVIFKQIAGNHTNTHLSDRLPWGLYIETFFFFSALGAGTLLFNAGVVIFKLEQYDKFTATGAAFSLGSLLAAGIVLGADLGKPFRIHKMVTGFNLSSPLTWDFFVLSVCALLNLLFLFDWVPGGFLLIIWSVVAALSALTFVMLHSLFLISKVEPGFRSRPFLALDTLVQAVLGGSAIINILILILSTGELALNKLLLALIILTMMINVGAQIGASSTGSKHQFDRRVIGLGLINLVILLYIIIFNTDGIILTSIVSILVLLSVFWEKSHIVRHSQVKPVLPKPFSQFDLKTNYKPSITEWMVALGGLGFCVMIFQGLFFIRNYLF